jgi:hypothetical protein
MPAVAAPVQLAPPLIEPEQIPRPALLATPPIIMEDMRIEEIVLDQEDIDQRGGDLKPLGMEEIGDIKEKTYPTGVKIMADGNIQVRGVADPYPSGRSGWDGKIICLIVDTAGNSPGFRR